ncbi:type IV secretory system conjugative DNA transfer family protein [Thalassobaculum sp. OXR-137]|uniref:type IV secretory system conjugative DNA transfer family protein n=1 Tax=Thalassobaculum sp. OXR-137 TaxID=3100173 RepID=UPI002AC994DF|nr:type IV secretory system conjugative DNA transfer family protein [Thalassobaculum sp. OXR-137]WPZ34513.1 type IV secretory system conjugative DNA transfer family protein [Thalassobaculum sp. OXR-137]
MDNASTPYGSAAFASRWDIARAGLFRQHASSLFTGFLGSRSLWYGGMGGVLLCAGARGGKLASYLAYSLLPGVLRDNSVVVLDPKGELAAISQNQTADGKFCAHWNPMSLCGLPSCRINPLDYVRIDSPSLVSDVKVFCANIIPNSGSPGGVYFEGRAREFLEALALSLTETNKVLTFPDLYRAINLIPAGGSAWLDVAFRMSESRFEIARRVEEEIAASRSSTGNGFPGILGELLKSFAALSDPVLMASVSPPFNFSMEQLTSGPQPWQVYLMPPAEFIEAWAPVIKAILVSGMIYKARAPSATQQTWVLDECALLGGFPLVAKLFSYGAGIGVRPVAVFQSTKQMRAIAPEAETIITASAALRCFFAVRDLDTATMVSRMLGSETLAHEDSARQEIARHGRHLAVQALIGGQDPMETGLKIAHHARNAALPAKRQRYLRSPDEILNTPAGKMYLFADGLPHPIYADRRPYYEERSMAGKFHPNPYHPPMDRVRVKTFWGHSWRPVITEPVPERFAHMPQYASGRWSRIG